MSQGCRRGATSYPLVVFPASLMHRCIISQLYLSFSLFLRELPRIIDFRSPFHRSFDRTRNLLSSISIITRETAPNVSNTRIFIFARSKFISQFPFNTDKKTNDKASNLFRIIECKRCIDYSWLVDYSCVLFGVFPPAVVHVILR